MTIQPFNSAYFLLLLLTGLVTAAIAHRFSHRPRGRGCKGPARQGALR